MIPPSVRKYWNIETRALEYAFPHNADKAGTAEGEVFAIGFSPDGKTIYVSDQPTNGVNVIDVAARKVVANIHLGESPEGVGYSPDGRWVAVAIEETNSVAIIDTGIDYNNPALGGGFGPGHRVIAGWDFANNDADNGDGVENPFTFVVSGTVTALPPEITVLDGTTAGFPDLPPTRASSRRSRRRPPLRVLSSKP